MTLNTPHNPQADQMADESMVRTLDAQARAIWPQEVQFLDRYDLPPNLQILDAGSGTGEGASRLADHFPRSRVLGVDVIEANLERAREVTGIALDQVVGYFENMIEQVRDPRRYAVWMVPVVSARVP